MQRAAFGKKIQKNTKKFGYVKNYLYLCSVKRNDDILAALKAARKKSREEEIAAHGKPINYSSIVKSKKAYTRKVKHKKIY